MIHLSADFLKLPTFLIGIKSLSGIDEERILGNNQEVCDKKDLYLPRQAANNIIKKIIADQDRDRTPEGLKAVKDKYNVDFVRRERAKELQKLEMLHNCKKAVKVGCRLALAATVVLGSLLAARYAI